MSTLPIGQQAGLPRTWEVGGEAFTVSGVTYHQLATLSDHLREAIPHPVDEARRTLEQLGDLLDPADRRRIAMDAYEEAASGRWPPSFDSERGNRYYFGHPDGVAFFLFTILGKHHPDLTLDEVRRRVAPRVSLADMDRLSVAIELVTEQQLAARKARALGVDPDAPPPGPGEASPAPPPPALHTEAGDPNGPSPPSGG